MARILVVDDEASIREFLDVLLSRAGHSVESVASVAEFKPLLDNAADLVISDFRIGKDSGLEVLQLTRSLPFPPEVIIVTAFGTPASAVEAMRRGAYDYITKPFDNDELLLLAERALEKRRLAEENRQLRSSLAPHANYVLGRSPAMQAVWSMVDKVAQARTTVLITGESGTGKEVIARAIHTHGPRARSPFLAVNCGALAEGVLESELFGHVKGAFTGASADRQGLLASAGDGTVLLDEIGEMPLSLQVKLLRVLQEKKVKPVGSSREVAFEARIVAATNRKLEEEVKAGRFREDLLFRLNIIPIEVPPLRQRAEDIAALANYFLARVGEELGRVGLSFAPETIALLERFPFPGNVRQLHNIVERAATLSDSEVLGVDALPASLRGVSEPTQGGGVTIPAGFSLERYLDATEREFLQEALKRGTGVKMRAAEILGLSFRSFRYRLAKHGLSE